MTASSKKTRQNSPLLPESDMLDLLPLHVARINASDKLFAINKPAQEFWSTHSQILPSSFRPLVDRVRESGDIVTAHEVPIIRHFQTFRATLHLVPMGDEILVTMDLKSAPHASASTWKQEITRAAGVMAAMLAHEVKNPLSGIRGAAQLLLESAGPEEKPLVELIHAETLRIRDLLDQVEVFSDERQVELWPLNIHEVIQYTLQVAKAGFAQRVKFVERYDPSLPQVASQRELLVQIVLNIIKNACEALAEVEDATVTITTAYQQGMRFADRKLPIVVKIEDNGAGIPAEIRKKLFEPLVSSKAQGRGLGLSVVAKVAADLGAVVECDERIREGAGFTIYLPAA